MTLQEKILQLKLDAAVALRHAQWWERQVAQHGITHVEAFYTQKLGLNHIETKAEFDGLQLRRQPRESERIAVKGVAMAQTSAQARLSSLLLGLRSELISDGLKGISQLTPAEYPQLVLQVSAEFRRSLRDRLIATYREGRQLVQRELGVQVKQDDEDDFDELDTLTDATTSRVTNDVQSRIIASAAKYAAFGFVAAALLDAVQQDVISGSTSYIERTATGAANRSLSIGRSDEAEQHDNVTVEYSALLDNNVCGPCAAEDGTTATNEADLQPAPNPECEGGDWCRCFHVYFNQ